MTKRLPVFDDIAGLPRFSGGDYCGLKDLVAYADSSQGGVFLKDLKTELVTRVTAGGNGESTPQFTENGEKLLFLSSKEEGRQIFSYDIESGTTEQLSHFQGPILEPRWSPDGTKILFASYVSGTSEHPKKHRPDEPVVITDYGYKFDGLGFIRPDGHQHLFVLDVSSGEVQKVTPSGTADYLHAAWAPDSRSFVCVSDLAHQKSEMLAYDLFLIRVDEGHFGEMKQISEGYMIVSYPNPLRPVFTPDGKQVIMGAVKAEEVHFQDGYPEIYLHAFPVDQSQAVCLFVSDENCYQCVQFPYNANCGWGLDKLQMDPSGEWIYFNAGWQGQGVLYRLKLHGDGHAEKVLSGKYIYHGASRIQDHKMMVTRSTPVTPEEYLILDLQSGEVTQAVQSAEKFLSEVELQMPEDVFTETSDGQGRIHGYALPPFHREAGKKYPTILYIHGGPTPFYTYGLTVEMQAFAAAGFGMIFCNPRGSTGYGKEHMKQLHAFSEDALQDEIDFVRAAIRQFDWIDEERLGATGGSYGGYMTNELAIKTDLFKAYISQRSMPNEMINYCSTDLTMPESMNYETYEEFLLEKTRKSQVSYAEKIHRPFLILHGEDDMRTPVEGAHQLFVALKDIHPELPVKMLIFPHTSHEQPSEPRLARRYYQEMVSWFRKYL